MKLLRSKLIKGSGVFKISSGRKRKFAKIKCFCGTTKLVSFDDFKRGKIKSCGCYHIKKSTEIIQKFNRTAKKDKRGGYKHGGTGTKLYTTFRGMTQRCYNKKSERYHVYGAKGIKIEWKSFEDFKKDMEASYKKHIKSHGKKNTTIDRISLTKNYSKENCRWATHKEQANNKTTNRIITYHGETMNLGQWAKELGINRTTLSGRLNTQKLSVEDAFKLEINLGISG